MKIKNVLIYFALKYEGDFEKMYSALNTREKVGDDFHTVIAKQKCKNVVTIVDENYPQLFKTLERPPMVFFYAGNLDLLDKEENLSILYTSEFARSYIVVKSLMGDNSVKLDYVICCEKFDDLYIVINDLKFEMRVKEGSNNDDTSFFN